MNDPTAFHDLPEGLQTMSGSFVEFLIVAVLSLAGIALGDVQSNRPGRIVVTYGDVLGTDLNEDVQGRLVFTRRKPAPPAP